MKKTASQIETDIYKYFKDKINPLINGQTYRSGVRPLNSQKEDCVISFLTGLDGQIFECTATVYAPKDTPKIEAGTTLQVVDVEGNIRLEKQVIRFSRDYFHCRIFV